MKAAGLVIVAVVLVLCGLPLVAVLIDTSAAPSCPATTPAATAPGRVAAAGKWNEEQVGNAAVIVSVGRQRTIPQRGWVIAVATAMVESRLRNVDGGDRDSLGLFQQRPSQGWGTRAQILDPVYAAGKFYQALQRVPRWESLPLTVAAQKVQRSAYPDAYADFEHAAGQVVARIGGVASIADLPGASLADCGAPGQVSAQGWVRPVSAPVGSGYGQRAGRLHAGVDLGAERNTVIRAASGGRVLWSGCDPGTGNCDVDGSSKASGCGWYVDILHAGEVGTRYCHMVRRPDVAEGDLVKVGDPIGLVGTSGHSSGPHLHFEVHLNVCAGGKCDLGPANSIDPVPYMRDVVHAPLGEGP